MRLNGLTEDMQWKKEDRTGGSYRTSFDDVLRAACCSLTGGSHHHL
jgi:hypothetical protein